MSGETDRTHLELWERSVTEETAEAGANSELEINVVFTDSEGTLAGLKTAGHLACDLGARINLVVAQTVPLSFPLMRPPVSIPFTEQRLFDLACQGVQEPLETFVCLYFCRDKRQILSQVLKPRSLVVIGGREIQAAFRPWSRWAGSAAKPAPGFDHKFARPPTNDVGTGSVVPFRNATRGRRTCRGVR